jgi:iron complex transport system ATP-binding protein
LSNQDRARIISLQPQFLRTHLPFRVADFVLLGRLPWKNNLATYGQEDRDIVLKALQETGSLELRHRLVSQLSGGEFQRVLIAQALAQTPQVLLLDEPTAHLDIGHQTEIMDMLAKLRAEKDLTIILISHDLNLAGAYSDRMALMHGGRVARIGKPEEVLEYQILESVYETKVVVVENPTTKRPSVFPIPGRVLKGSSI